MTKSEAAAAQARYDASKYQCLCGLCGHVISELPAALADRAVLIEALRRIVQQYGHKNLGLVAEAGKLLADMGELE
jgi:hypothetical protein